MEQDADEDLTDALVAIPVLNRPERVEGLMWSLRNGRGEREYKELFLASPGDDAEIAELKLHRAYFLVVDWPPGAADWAKKINLAYRETTEPWVFTASDDVCFCPGWLDRALDCADATGARVLGTNDLGSPRVVRGQHATHNLVARSYADELGTVDGPGAVICEKYDHNFCDDELVQTAKARGEWAFCKDAWVEHLHPSWGKGDQDATYRKGMARFNADRALFHQRSPLWR